MVVRQVRFGTYALGCRPEDRAQHNRCPRRLDNAQHDALWSHRGLIIFVLINSAKANEANSTKEHDH
eukprot:5429754-Heterocapsa_arctica.AAC.1